VVQIRACRRTLLEYKTKRDGTPLILVKPRNTSRQCPKCGYSDKKNRRSRTFKCLKSGYTEMADYVAALNIAARASVNEPHGNVSFFDSTFSLVISITKHFP
jgi:putative transposase